MAVLHRVDGTSERIMIADRRGLTLDQMQAAVGGYIEVVPVGPMNTARERDVLIVNDMGRLEQRPVNAWATRRAGQVIVGDVIEGRLIDPGLATERVI